MPNPDEKDPTSPATTSIAYDGMLPLWEKIDTLLAGTDAMRDAGQLYLPKHPEESAAAYIERLSVNTLLNMLQFTLDAWTGKPFIKPVNVGSDVPQEIVDLLPNIDLQGNSINIFARDWFRDGLAKAFSHVLVDYPRKNPLANGQPRTLADDRSEKVRPYLVRIPPENIIFAYAEIVDGVERLLHVRIKETETVIVGFAEKQVQRIRVFTPGHVDVYELQQVKNRKDPKWVQIDEYDYDLPYIPIKTFYSDKTGLMQGKPPLADLADLNIRHWQSTSDQIAVLTVSRFPIMAASGAMEDDKMIVGPNRFLFCPDASGRFYYVEHSGKAIAAGQTDLDTLENTMAQYGATFLRKRPGGASATARALDSAETTSPLQDVATRFGDALNGAMNIVADWMKLPTAGTFTVVTDFKILDNGGARLVALQGARMLGDISASRYTDELQRFGVLDDDFDFDADQLQIKKEPPPIAATVMPPTTQEQPPALDNAVKEETEPTK